MRKNKIKITGGFTFVELLIVLMIMSIIAVISFIGLKTIRQDQDVKNASGEIKSIIRLAQSNAFANVKCNSATGSKSALSWITKINRSNNNYSLNVYCAYKNPDDPTTPLEESVKSYKLTNQVTIDNVKFPAGNCDITNTALSWKVDIKFEPLTGGIYYEKVREDPLSENVCTSIQHENINLELLKDGTDSKKIQIDRTGKIVDTI